MNNAVWCAAVASAHGAPCEMQRELWLHRGIPIPLYPNLVTLRAAGGETQVEAVRDLGLALGVGWGVKDSFSALDLASLGFEILFAAEWIVRPEGADPVLAEPLRETLIARVTSEAELSAWERAWKSADATAPQSRIFPPALVEHPEIDFIAARRGGRVVAGAVVNRSGSVAGLSNLFAIPRESPAIFAAVIDAAAAMHRGLPLVGYAQDGGLQAMIGVGFAPVGPLRVWTCD